MSALLLVSFSMILFPLDFFHNHSVGSLHISKAAKESTSTKQLKADGADYCWVCSVHFDKSFTNSTFVDKVEVSVPVSAFAESDFLGYFIEQLFSTLRGPPSK